MKDHDVVVSLGTSDVVFACVSDPRPALEGNIFCSPINTDGYMLLLWFVLLFSCMKFFILYHKSSVCILSLQLQEWFIDS